MLQKCGFTRIAVASPEYRKHRASAFNIALIHVLRTISIIATANFPPEYFFAPTGPNLRPNLGTNTALQNHAKTNAKEILHQY
jgi:hypothetical protein